MRQLKIENEKLRMQSSWDSPMSQFSILNSQFDVVTCFYDSVNYLTDEGDLERVCAGVARALRPDGYLIFDINTAAEYATWDERDCVTHDGHDCLVYNQLSYDPDARLATGRIVWFVRELDRWWRGEETHIERAWGDDAVREALDGAGLALVGRYDLAGGVAAEDAARVVYVAQRMG
jgi:SAM-dependent methyltransferase